MAILTDIQRIEIRNDIMVSLSQHRETILLNKLDLQGAVNAVDNWINANAGSFNAALPVPVQIALTAKQKLRLFLSVVQKRFNIA